MELDDLKHALTIVDRRLERTHALQLDFHKTSTVDRVRASLRPLMWGHIGQVALGLAVALAVGPFWWLHRAQLNLMAAGIALHVYAVLMIALGARVLVLLHTLDLAEPVVAIQKRLAKLDRSYLTTSLAVGLPWWLLWLPLLMVLSGVDLVSRAPTTWLLASLGIGVVGIAGTLFWSWRRIGPDYGSRADRAGVANSVRNAQRLLEQIARFERG